MSAPLLLDLFCGAGGAAMGYARAGFDVIGVDIAPQPHYPFRFLQGEALEVARRILVNSPVPVAAIHASPPCQRHNKLAKGTKNSYANHPELIAPTRGLLAASGVPYVIENVVGAPLDGPVELCGEMFGLGVIRHRLFETNWALSPPAHVPHRGRCKRREHGQRYDGPYFGVYGHGGGKDGSVADWQAAMGVDWMPVRRELTEAIPPAYTAYIGRQLMTHLRAVVA